MSYKTIHFIIFAVNIYYAHTSKIHKCIKFLYTRGITSTWFVSFSAHVFSMNEDGYDGGQPCDAGFNSPGAGGGRLGAAGAGAGAPGFGDAVLNFCRCPAGFLLRFPRVFLKPSVFKEGVTGGTLLPFKNPHLVRRLQMLRCKQI